MPDVKEAKDLLVACVQDLYAAEIKAGDRFASLADDASDPDLKAAVEGHCAQSREQSRRLEAAADLLGESASGPSCLWAEGVLDDAKRDSKTVAPGPLLDAALIGALRKLEHAEIVSYETAIGVARAIGLPQIVQLLQQSHGEEQAMDSRLVPLLARAIGRPSIP